MGNYPAALGELHALQGLMGKQSSSEKPASRRRQGEKQSIFQLRRPRVRRHQRNGIEGCHQGGDLCAGANF